ncbi:hypothetical protein CASFOL_033530 [Castilleja foliolosa]|uniref:Expansin-like EG45 domain-containing protein n=1 Tax=Castilleja foliolosa TaxID=1961234 RepID=A0ABD3BYG2_9LAMI
MAREDCNLDTKVKKSYFFEPVHTLLSNIKVITVSEGDVGTGKAYDPPYTPTKCYGNDPNQFPSGNLFVAVSEGLWDNGAACGRRYRIKCTSSKTKKKKCKDGTIDVTVVDYCKTKPCPATIMFSNHAFYSISKVQSIKINVEYVQI